MPERVAANVFAASRKGKRKKINENNSLRERAKGGMSMRSEFVFHSDVVGLVPLPGYGFSFMLLIFLIGKTFIITEAHFICWPRRELLVVKS